MISIEDFNRARELLNRIVDLKEQLAPAFAENREKYTLISGDVNSSGLSKIIQDFSNSIYSQNGNIQRNLNELFIFLQNQISSYENINQDAEARMQQTANELDSFASSTVSSVEQI